MIHPGKITERHCGKTLIPFYASPVIAGGVLYAAREDGVVFPVGIEDGFDFIGENAMGEQILATPVPFDGKLLIRTSGHFICVE